MTPYGTSPTPLSSPTGTTTTQPHSRITRKTTTRASSNHLYAMDIVLKSLVRELSMLTVSTLLALSIPVAW